MTRRTPGPVGGRLDDDAVVVARSVCDHDQFAVIYDRYVGEIYRYVAGRLGRDVAEDLAAETFLIAFRKRERFDPALGTVRPWLYGIATTLVGQHRREETRRYRALARAGRLALDSVESHDDRVADAVTAGQLSRQLAAALAGLANGDRDVLLLVAISELSHQEVALALDIPYGTVGSRLNRARRALRRRWAWSIPRSITRRQAMDEMSIVRRLLAEPPPALHVVAEGRERLLGSLTGAAPTTRTMRRAVFRGALTLGLTSAAAAAALAVATLVPGVGTSSGGGGPAITERSARTVLLAAASRAESVPASGTYWHLRTMSTTNSPQRFGHGDNRYTLERLWVHEWATRNGQAWSGDRRWVRPTTPQDQAAWRRDGAPTHGAWGKRTRSRPSPTACTPHPAPPPHQGLFPVRSVRGLQLTFRQLQRLYEPRTAPGLAGRRRPAPPRPSAGAAVINQNVAAELAGLLVYLPVPPGIRAAAYRALADMPNVTSIGPTRDELGRAGVGIKIAEGRGWIPVPGDPVRCHDKYRCYPAAPARNIARTLIIDPGTSQVLADETTIGKSSYSDTLILGVGWTNEKPRKPARP